MEIESTLLDTTFLIDLQREISRKRIGRASQYLGRGFSGTLCISLITYMEFAEGFATQSKDAFDQFVARFRIIRPDSDTAWLAAGISRDLRADGSPIGDHDVWIAASAIQRNLLLVSRNRKHFERVPALKLATY